LTTGFVTHHDCSRHDTGWAHPEHQGRLPAIARAVYREMLTFHGHLQEIEGVPAPDADLLLAHDSSYVQRVRAAVAEAANAGKPQPFQNGAMVSGATWDAITAASGCAITAVDAVWQGTVTNAFCAIRPPGSGAHSSSAGAHAILNNVAIAARHLRLRRGVDRVLILEVGENFGAGTADIVRSDPGIRYLSLHSTRSDVPTDAHPFCSIPLEPGADLQEMMEALRRRVAEMSADFDPQFLILSLGLDVLDTDPLGSLALHPPDLWSLTRWVMELAAATCGGQLVSVLEGGYDPPAVGSAVVYHLRALSGIDR
jgi:acetoin utilization deacetylase AcuC-like enzyme